MRLPVPAATLALALLASAAGAQAPLEGSSDRSPSGLTETAGATPATERVLMDLVFWTLPGPVSETCIELPRGRLTVTLRLEGERTRPPASFIFGPARQRDPDPDAEIRATVTSEPATVQVPLLGGHYCYAILNHSDTPPRTHLTTPEPVGQAQSVAVKMTLATD